ncbi:MAG: hypothetical protein PHI97_15795 [Desulfobulbus sp.]|nr:hypothetical protein [Desulfobulbus sp.]
MRLLFVLPLLFSLAAPLHAESQPVASETQSPPPLLLAPPVAKPAAQAPAWLPQKQKPTVAPALLITPEKKDPPKTIKEAVPAPSGNTDKNLPKVHQAVKSNGNAKIARKPAAAPEVKNNKNGTGEEADQIKIESVLTKELEKQDRAQRTGDTLQMLTSLMELQKTLKQQIAATTKKLKSSRSESEKQSLQEEIVQLDKQLNETSIDFERLATGVDSAVFSDKQDSSFSWKQELSTLVEPSIKQLKQLTAKARQKSELKDTIGIYQKQSTVAHKAVDHIDYLVEQTKDGKIKAYLSELLPAWQNMEKRIDGKLDLARRELMQLEANDVSIFQSTGRSIRDFFRDRGWFLLIALSVFIGILLGIRLLARLLFRFLPGARKENRPAHIRFLAVFFQFFSVIAAISGLIAALYLAEDWFLLSAAIVLMLGLVWTIRQTLPKMWQQARLMLNMGSIREGERVIYQNVPWKVEAINVFCKLYNPTMGRHLRVPIENMIGLVSRPFEPNEPWFPCQKGDWVAIDGRFNAKVVSLSHELVEVVELGGRKTLFPTADFLSLSPANLSTNFFIRVVFGLSYDLQKEITTTVLVKLNAYIQQKFEENGFAEDCLSLSVDFLQAGASSLDVVIFANMKGDQAPSIGKIERSISRWCVECCNQNNWEIPFPQMTVHLPGHSK